MDECSFYQLKTQIINGQKTFDFKCLIIGIKVFTEKYNQLILYNNEYKCEIFLLDVNRTILVGTILIIKKISIKEIKSVLYCVIDEYNNIIEIPNAQSQKLLYSKSFDIFKIKKCACLSELQKENDNTLISIDLRVNSFENGIPKFIDYEKKRILINLKDFNLKFIEKRKKYSLHRFLWKNNQLNFNVISNIEELNEKSILKKEDYETIQKINNFENKKICNCYGKIISATFLSNLITLKEINSDNIIDIELNDRLIKNISFNGICYFKNFKKYNNNKLKDTNISNLIIEEKTIIKLIFLDYDNTNNQYQKIKVNNQIININNKIVEFELENLNLNNYFGQKIKYVKQLNENQSKDLIIDIYKGKINSFYSYLNLKNDGFCYEFFYQSNKEELLPKTQSVKINDKDYVINEPEKFENTLKERFNIINIQKQNIVIDKITNLNLEGNQEDYKYWKIVNLISDEKQITTNIFKIKEYKKILKSFSFEDEFEKQLNLFYQKIYKINVKSYYNQKELIKKKYNLLFDSRSFMEEEEEEEDEESKIEEEKSELEESEKENDSLEQKINYNNYIIKGINKYEFKDTQNNFKRVKKLCFLLLLKYTNGLEILESIINEYYTLFPKIIKLNYFNQIKIIISFTYFKITEKRNYRFIHLDFSEFFPLKKAHNALINILDKIDEKSCFFIGLQEMNSLIQYDYSNKHYMFTGSLLTLNDVKLDFIKVINKYYFISDMECNDYAIFNPNCEIITLFTFSSIGMKYWEIINNSDKDLNDNISVFSFIF